MSVIKGSVLSMLAMGALLVSLGGCRHREPGTPSQPGAPGEQRLPEQQPKPMQPKEEPSPAPTGQPQSAPQGSRNIPGPAFGYTPGEASGAEQRGSTGQGAGQGAEQGAGQQQRLASAPEPVRTYVIDVTMLESVPPEPGKAEAATVEAMRSLASALRALPAAPGRAQSAATAIETHASRMERSTTGAARTGAVKDALAEAIDALEAVRRERAQSNLDLSVAQAHVAADRIDASAPFQEQRTAINRAFLVIGDALVIAGQEPNPLRQAPERQPDEGQPRQPMQPGEQRETP